MSMETEIKSLTMAIQYASRATSLIQETEQQTGELLNLVNQIRSMARKMTLPDIRDTDRKKTETQINKLWGEVSKITSPDGVDSLNDPMPMSRPTDSALTDKQKALSNLDKAAAQLELQRDALAETSAGVMETIDILTRTASANIMTSKNPSLKASIDHVEKSAAMMAERAQTTKAAQKQAASALFTQILHLI
jgi:flagellin-like hook-associated protein FlgL